MDRDQGDDVPRGEARAANGVDGSGERAAGVDRLVDDDGDRPSLGAADERGPFPRRQPFLRADGHRVGLVIALGFEKGPEQRSEVRTGRPQPHDEDRAPAVGIGRDQQSTELEDVDVGQVLRSEGRRNSRPPAP